MDDGGRGTARTASASVVKAGIALGLMVVFFFGFFLAPGATAGAALLLVLIVEIVRRR